MYACVCVFIFYIICILTVFPHGVLLTKRFLPGRCVTSLQKWCFDDLSLNGNIWWMSQAENKFLSFWLLHLVDFTQEQDSEFDVLLWKSQLNKTTRSFWRERRQWKANGKSLTPTFAHIWWWWWQFVKCRYVTLPPEMSCINYNTRSHYREQWFSIAGQKYWFSVFIKIGCFRHYSVWKHYF